MAAKRNTERGQAYSGVDVVVIVLQGAGVGVVLAGAFGSLNVYLADATVPYAFWVAPIGLAIVAAVMWIMLKHRLAKERATKYNFVAVAGHRLRTPLTRMQWALSELSATAKDESQEGLITQLTDTTNELADVSEQLLNAAEAGEGSLFFNYLFEMEDLGRIAYRVVAEYQPGVDQKELTLHTDIDSNLPHASIDHKRLTTAAGALLENAIIYTPQGGEITVEVYQERNDLVFSVSDTGMGVSSEAQPYVFERFYRAKEAVAMEQDRAGLGLAIAQEVVHAHGGELYLHSKGKDRGTTVQFTIPLP